MAPGDELRFAARLEKRNNVVVSSLNYIGTQSAIAENAKPIEEGIKSFDPRRKAWWVDRRAEPVEFVWNDEGVIGGPRSNELSPLSWPLVAAADPSLSHGGNVIGTIIDAYHSENGGASTSDGPGVIAACLEDSSINAVDLWALGCLLLSLSEVPWRVAAINLSFDLGLICGPKDGLPSPLGNYITSFPLFESILDSVILSYRRRGYDPPLVFAAAGNCYDVVRGRGRVMRNALWRLAYPAILPDVIAVTHAEPVPKDGDRSISKFRVANWADIPSVGPLKPCFAEIEIPEPVCRHGTSFACAALAGRVAYWDEKQKLREKKLGQFDKLALLMGSSDRLDLGYDPQPASTPWVPATLNAFSPDKEHQESLTEAVFSFRELVAELNDNNRDREFLLTGSAAFIEEWLSSKAAFIEEWLSSKTDSARAPAKAKLSKDILDLVGDLDLVYSGAEIDDAYQSRVMDTVEKWVNKITSFTDSWKERVQLHSMRGWTSGIHLLQCVIPAASTFVASRGTINPWGIAGLGEGFSLKVDELKLYEPDSRAWDLNPQYNAGSSGPAHAFLIRLNLCLLNERLRMLFTVGNQAPSDSKNITDFIDATLASAIRLKFPFGRVNPNAKDRVSRRLERTAKLASGLDDAAKIPERVRVLATRISELVG